MRTGWAALCAVVAAGVPAYAQDACGTERNGTRVKWTADFEEGCRRAEEEGRMLFVLHLSGDLPEAGRT